jgi:hypothetical protein
VNRLTREKGIAGGGVQTWHVYLLLGVLTTSAYFLLPSQAAQHTLHFLFVLSALAAILTGVHTHRPSQPLPWYLFACAMLMSILGFVTYGYYETVLGIESPLTTWADVFFIASYPCAASRCSSDWSP